MNLADMLRNSPLRRQRNEGQGEYDRPESYYRNQGIDGQPLPSISDRLQSMGMDSSIKDRPMLIPVREDGEWTAPEWFHSMARGAMLPAQAALGGTVTPLDTAMATADFAGGGLLSSKAIPNAVPDGAVLGATAWHGSPHKFDKFDMSKIGTGEGAQAYGHGLYAAENRRVANDYKEKLSDLSNMIHYDGTPLINLPVGEKEALNQLERAMPIFKGPKVGGGELGFSDSVEFARNKMKDNPTGMQFLDNVDESKIAWGNGNLYKMDIPDDQIAKMLDWDKPLSGQGEKMHNVWEKFLGSGVGKRSKKSLGMYDEDVRNRSGNFNQPTGEDFHNLIYEGMPRAKGQTHGGGATFQEGDMTAAWLKRQGIPGIKYLDQGSRTGGQGTSNFVLFADDIAKILERNDQPIGDLAKGLLE